MNRMNERRRMALARHIMPWIFLSMNFRQLDGKRFASIQLPNLSNEYKNERYEIIYIHHAKAILYWTLHSLCYLIYYTYTIRHQGDWRFVKIFNVLYSKSIGRCPVFFNEISRLKNDSTSYTSNIKFENPVPISFMTTVNISISVCIMNELLVFDPNSIDFHFFKCVMNVHKTYSISFRTKIREIFFSRSISTR